MLPGPPLEKGINGLNLQSPLICLSLRPFVFQVSTTGNVQNREIFGSVQIGIKDVATSNDTNLDCGHDFSVKGKWLESFQFIKEKNIQQSRLLIFPSGRVVLQNFASEMEALVKLALYKSALLRSANIKLALPRLACRKSASTSNVPSRFA